ncbi:MAG: hypothetical protein JWN12_316 [Candidatus Saccharibacteria bacterium]|nr:hypothetical protein [Candidatus Saccharibacteria bacterium]
MKHFTLSSLFKPVISLFRRYHITIFIVFVVAGLGYAVFSFTNLLGEASTDTTYTSPISAGTIDQATLDRITALHTSDGAAPALATPPGRINPFSE